MSKSKRVRITGIHKHDAHYHRKDYLIGTEGTFELESSQRCPGYCVGAFYPGDESNDAEYFYFVGVRYKKIQQKKKVTK